jgi:prolyl oligopeptidase|tara:strand:+ start:11643 stop:13760 length:2118 start_codon:yes stop_codon:yes gene_type:complete
MRNPTFLLFLGVSFLIFLNKKAPEDLRYPKTIKEKHFDQYFDTTITDPYRWLEDDYSKKTKAWIARQNSFTNSYMRKIPFRNKIEKRLTELWDHPSQGMPFKKGESYYYYYNNGLQDQSVLYVQDTPNSIGEIFLDPNNFSHDGTISLGGVYFSNDNKYLGYSTNSKGSDWQEFFIIDLGTGEQLKDHLKWVKFSGMAWHGNGFFYKKYPRPDENKELSDQNQNSKVFYHKVGTPQNSDKLIFYDPLTPKISPWISTIKDEKYLFLYRSSGTYGVSLSFRSTDTDSKKWNTIVDDYESSISIIDHVDGMFIAKTDKGAPFKRIVRIDPNNPLEKDWETLISGSEDEVLTNIKFVGNKFFVHFTDNIFSIWKVFDIDGNYLYDIDLPGKGILNGFGGDRNQHITWFTFNNLVNPSTIYQYNTKLNRYKVYKESLVDFNRSDFILKQDFFPSKDGTMIPIFIAHKKNLEMDGLRPTLLYGYGGFNIGVKPYFSKSNIILLEKGGVYAIANIRGGSEYGENWHKDGMLLNKQNVFDDFIAAAQFLEKTGITCPNYLAIKGRSNGGLLIGAVLNQRPDICRVAFPEVGVMDMLRYEKFTIGHAWSVEYGSVSKEEHFNNLIKYSPLHNIHKQTHYPSVLIYTADHDDRVVPAHSFKYAATLQDGQSGKEPVLLRVGNSSGHGSGKPTKKVIEELAEKWAFMFYEMGLEF